MPIGDTFPMPPPSRILPAMQHLIEDLKGARIRRAIVTISDSGQTTDLYWSPDSGQWVIVNAEKLHIVPEIAVVSAPPDSEAVDEALNRIALASNLMEDGRALWILDAAQPIPQGAEIVWRSDKG
ncbi:MAG: hypothetical protein ACT4QC_08440 [Planctomycetaceae bacterium]